jgi:hypothetical protein
MKLRRRTIFLVVFLFLFSPAAAAAAAEFDTPDLPCEAKEPSEWLARIDKEPSGADPGDPGAAEAERVLPAARTPLAVPTPLAKPANGRDSVFRQAYEDVYSILSSENECSRFYGGAAPAAYVFNQLAARFKPARVGSSHMAGKMSGEVVNISHAPSGIQFRLFEKAVLNTAGAFYSRQGFQSDARVPRVGSFAPDTRGARALILLHELGHVVKGQGGDWLLPDDGGDAERSEHNTELVEARCGAQLRALGTQPRQARPAEVAKSPARERATAERDTAEQ